MLIDFVCFHNYTDASLRTTLFKRFAAQLGDTTVEPTLDLEITSKSSQSCIVRHIEIIDFK